MMAAAVARQPGARFVVITDVNPRRLELAKEFGVSRAWTRARRRCRGPEGTWA